jgi:hypothetical protein
MIRNLNERNVTFQRETLKRSVETTFFPTGYDERLRGGTRRTKE